MANIKIGEKEYSIRELRYGEILSLGELSKQDLIKRTIILATGMTEEEFNNLSLKDGLRVGKAVDTVNSLPEDFRMPPEG